MNLHFVCGHRDIDDKQCGEPAIYFYHGGEHVRPLCEIHAREYEECNFIVVKWELFPKETMDE